VSSLVKIATIFEMESPTKISKKRRYL